MNAANRILKPVVNVGVFGKKLLAGAAASSLLFLASAGVAGAQWQVDNDNSRVSFITTKLENVAEVHRFNQIEGTLDNKGHFDLTIPLESVNTAIEIRDQRMRDLLFEIAKFPQLKLSAQVSSIELKRLAVGESIQRKIGSDIKLHGQTASVTFDVLISKLSEDKILVASLQPVVIGASVFNLYNGVEKLRKIAGLKSISKAVPVSFVLVLLSVD